MSDQQPELPPAPSDDDFDWEQALSELLSPADAPPDEGVDATQDDSGDVPGTDAAVEDAEVDGGATDAASGGSGEPPAAGRSDLAAAADQIDLGNGVTMSRAEVEQIANLRLWMQQYPDQTEQFIGVLTGQYDVVPRGQQPEPEPESTLPPLDDEDLSYLPPAVQARLRAIDEMEARLREQQQAVHRTSSEVEQYQQQQAAAAAAAAYSQAVEVGLATFRDSHPDLTDDDIITIRQEAAQLGIASRIAEQTGDPVRAVNESMEIAFLRSPEFRQRELDALQQQVAQEAQRRRKIDAVAGNSGSAPRTTRAPSTPEERMAAMVEELRAATRGEHD